MSLVNKIQVLEDIAEDLLELGVMTEYKTQDELFSTNLLPYEISFYFTDSDTLREVVHLPDGSKFTKQIQEWINTNLPPQINPFADFNSHKMALRAFLMIKISQALSELDENTPLDEVEKKIKEIAQPFLSRSDSEIQQSKGGENDA